VKGVVMNSCIYISRKIVVRFEVLTAVVMTGSLCRDITLCSPLKINQHFLGMCRSFACYLLHSGFLFDLFFNPEDGRYIFLKNIGWYSTDSTVLCSRRQNSLGR
jgi:hypothetical protein